MKLLAIILMILLFLYTYLLTQGINETMIFDEVKKWLKNLKNKINF
jgi:hypothetical protein